MDALRVGCAGKRIRLSLQPCPGALRLLTPESPGPRLRRDQQREDGRLIWPMLLGSWALERAERLQMVGLSAWWVPMCLDLLSTYLHMRICIYIYMYERGSFRVYLTPLWPGVLIIYIILIVSDFIYLDNSNIGIILGISII